MKILKLILIFFAISITIPEISNGQIFEKIKKKAKQVKDRKENEAVDKIFKDAEDAAKNNKNDDNDSKKNKSDNNADNPNNGSKTTKKELELWTVKYDFEPGKEVIFYDDLENEEVGEIPSKWKFLGGGLETVKMGDNKVLKWWDKETRPNFKNDNVLPDQFTVEFDVYFYGPPGAGYGYNINFYQKGESGSHTVVSLDYGSMQINSLTSAEHVPGTKNEDFYNTWHHISLSYNKGSLKGYLDQYRLFNARLTAGKKVDYISFYNCCTTSGTNHVFLIDNIRFAKGAHAKYKEDLLSNGRITTNNILFTTNKADILPHSYAEVKRIADIMKANAEMKFNVEGHTDSDGDDQYNINLSEKRAKAVIEALANMGIDKSRLTAKGFGELIPIATNDTPEGKAMNRRVEFVKQ